jgi:tRNA A-37 threonylcarbamoyl transferase component Bud32
MVVTDVLEDDFQPCDEFDGLVKPCNEAIRDSVHRLHTLGFVRGDLRDRNVFVREKEGQWDCQLIDFDWAGRVGEVKYPIGVYDTSVIWRSERYMDGQVIYL